MNFNNLKSLFAPFKIFTLILSLLYSQNLFAGELKKKVAIVSLSSCQKNIVCKDSNKMIIKEFKSMDNINTVVINGDSIDIDSRFELASKMKEISIDGAIRLKTDNDGLSADIIAKNSLENSIFYTLKFQDDITDKELITFFVLQIVETLLSSLIDIDKKNIKETETVKEKNQNQRDKILYAGAMGGIYISPKQSDVSLLTNLYIKIKPLKQFMFIIEGAYSPIDLDTGNNLEKLKLKLVIVRGLLMLNSPIYKRMIFSAGGAGGFITAITNQPSTGISKNEFVAYAGTALRFQLYITRSFIFVSQFMYGLLIPEINVSIDEKIEKSFGKPFLEVSAGFEFAFI
ncbi:MAG: hypothetical protein JXR91_03470 [Deltaproteobacteria bacterium]|nr:hypothetical protein [Deltaproteobacteria bacterium]